eukprot:6185119-Pleurochrysis_carterae.AAC.2
MRPGLVVARVHRSKQTMEHNKALSTLLKGQGGVQTGAVTIGIAFSVGASQQLHAAAAYLPFFR